MTQLRVMIGKRIREKRLAMGLTQVQVAKRMKIRQGHWSEIECGRQSFTLKTLERIAKVLRCAIRDLL